MTIAQIAYIASLHESRIADLTHVACVEAAARLGVLDETMREFARLRKSAAYRARKLGKRMREFDPVAFATSWKRPYSSVEWAWVRALGVVPSAVWVGEAPQRPRKHKRKHERPSREVRECFANERRVDLQDRS